MNKKRLAIILSKLKKINLPKANLEQYQTEPETAADILWGAYLSNDIDNKIVGDFGSGNGIFGIGALILGAKKVYFVEIDKNNISLIKENLSNLEFKKPAKYEIYNINVKDFDVKVDTVIENPPFGVQKKHADKLFLDKSFSLAKTVYSLHKIESNNFVMKIAEEKSFKIVRLIQIDLILKRSMSFHKKSKHIVKVGCWVLKKK